MWLTLDCNKKNGPPGPGAGSRAQINIVPEAFGKHDLLEHAAASARFPRSARFSRLSPIKGPCGPFCGRFGGPLGRGPTVRCPIRPMASPPLGQGEMPRGVVGSGATLSRVALKRLAKLLYYVLGMC
jgi:hypothetical protein